MIAGVGTSSPRRSKLGAAYARRPGPQGRRGPDASGRGGSVAGGEVILMEIDELASTVKDAATGFETVGHKRGTVQPFRCLADPAPSFSTCSGAAVRKPGCSFGAETAIETAITPRSSLGAISRPNPV